MRVDCDVMIFHKLKFYKFQEVLYDYKHFNIHMKAISSNCLTVFVSQGFDPVFVLGLGSIAYPMYFVQNIN